MLTPAGLLKRMQKGQNLELSAGHHLLFSRIFPLLSKAALIPEAAPLTPGFSGHEIP